MQPLFKNRSQLHQAIQKLHDLSYWLPASKRKQHIETLRHLEQYTDSLHDNLMQIQVMCQQQSESLQEMQEKINQKSTKHNSQELYSTPKTQNSQLEKPSIMIFETSPDRQPQEQCELYCNEDEELQAWRQKKQNARLLKHSFSPIAQVLDEGSTTKKAYKPITDQVATKRPKSLKRYNYLDRVRHYLC